MLKSFFKNLRIKLAPKENNSTVFTRIYDSNKWNSKESVSGKGSELNQTKLLIDELSKLIAERKIESMLDVPCGDFNWMQHVGLSGLTYIGADIVPDLIAQNSKKFENSENVSFQVIDLTADHLPTTDLLFVRDCLVHLSLENIHNAIKNIKESGSKYILTTTFPDYKTNYDIKTGSWRKINLQKAPFNFPEPILLINEKCPQGNGKFSDKSMALWNISDL